MATKTTYQQATDHLARAEAEIRRLQRLLASPDVQSWTDEQRLDIHAGLQSLIEDAEEAMLDVPAPEEAWR